ncbi:MAG: hypothetical protein KAW92_06925 [Candidatus Cloacimonetes bacterium]|nr:hypothetical protein [Candidatus Cloacimonadota bacterium]
MKRHLSCQICTTILIERKINGITVYECPICGQLHNQDRELIEYRDLYKNTNNELED